MKQFTVIAIAAAITTSAGAAELPLKRVVLSTSGLAQFTHRGQATPGTGLDLAVRLDQVDDLLKSLTIFDPANAIGAVSLAGKAPLAELFRDLPFGQDALTSPSALLNALVGAEVEIEGSVNAKGRVFRVEDELVQLPNNGGQISRHRLTLLTDKGLVQAILEDLSAIRFTDAVAKAQIDRAIAGVAQNRAKERRTVSITMLGNAARDVGFTYVVAAPVWKTAYRVVLPKEGGRARLQGWGVVENLTGSDWKEIDLSLISGNPVALKQALYSAVYADRPEIPVTASMRVVPKQDDADEGSLRKRIGRAVAAAPAPLAQNQASRSRSQAQYEKLAPDDQDKEKYFRFGSATKFGDASGAVEETIGSAALATESEEAATQIVYKFPAPISLTAGSTMMIPFLDREIAATRTWLYQPETNERRPLAAVRLKNDSEGALPGGIITAFDMSGDGAANFAGDAQLPLMPKGSFKFVTFALDSKSDVRRINLPIKQSRLGTAVKGQLTLTVRSRWTTSYEITPPADEDRDLVIDEARADGWKLADGTKDVEETAARLRYKVSAPKGKTTKAELVRERVEVQTVSLSGQKADQLLTTVSGLENESPALRDAVRKLTGLVSDIAQANGRRRDLETQRKKIGDDQERIRRNLTAVGQGSDLGRRYLDNLKFQEDRLTAIDNEEKAIDADIVSKQKAAEETALALTL